MAKEAQKTYLVQRRIRWAMIGTFVCSLLIILVASIIFFYMFLDSTLNLSVVSIFDAHTYSIVKDIVQVKRNDFILVQNELKASAALILDLIEDKNFNKYSLYEDGADPNVYHKDRMKRMRKYLRSVQLLIDEWERSGVWPEKDMVNWHFDTDFNALDDTELAEQIWKTLKGYGIDSTYDKLTQQQVNDIITCAASIYIRQEYAMKFKFTDLQKTENYLGFESGIFCTYPNPSTATLAGRGRTDCEKQKDFLAGKNYYPKDQPLPTHFDHRCRPWYQKAYKQSTTVFSDPYLFIQGIQGMTSCIPLWRQPTIEERRAGISQTEKQYHGTYCFDVMPTSRNDEFLKKYYSIEEYHIDYLIFHEDEAFKEKRFQESEFGELMKALVFNQTSDGQDYTVKEIKLQEKKLNELNDYMMEYKDQYDLTDIALLPSEAVSIGEVIAVNNKTGEEVEFIFILDDFIFDLLAVKDGVENGKAEFKFALFLPKSIIQTKIDEVKQQVSYDIRMYFILPFVIFSTIMMLITSYCLSKISSQITEPIIELYDKIKMIINSHQKEKERFNEQHGLGEKFNRMANKKEQANQGTDIMLNYRPRNNEINTLYLAFSNLTKSINVARNSLHEGDDNQALLNYHEVAQIFEQLKNREKKGSCMNNLGCIYLKKHQFEKSQEFLNQAISIQNEIIHDEDKLGVDDRNRQEHDSIMNSYKFILACRLYNKALSSQRYIINVITDYLQHHSLTQFVKSIPTQSDAVQENKNKADIFFQKAVLSTLNKVAKKKLFLHYCHHHPELRQKLTSNYNSMIQCFNLSQQILKTPNFTIEFQRFKEEKELLDAHEFNNNSGSSANQMKISYFSDFIFMQQLMTLEVDILLGQTDNSMKYLVLDQKQSNVIQPPLKKSRTTVEEVRAGHHKKVPLSSLEDSNTLNRGHTNQKKIKAIEQDMDKYFEFVKQQVEEEAHKNLMENPYEKEAMTKRNFEGENWNDKHERYGLQQFRRDHLTQYLSYLKGLQLEVEVGDFYGAKQHYIDSLTETLYVNHRIRKQTLEKLMSINQKIGGHNAPEKVFISRYYLKEKWVQVILDTQSFSNTKTLKACMILPKMIFNSLQPNDRYGLKILKNGFKDLTHTPTADTGHSKGGNKQAAQNEFKSQSHHYLQDVVVLEQKNMNTMMKEMYLEDFTEDLQELNQKNLKQNRTSVRDTQLRNKEMKRHTLLALHDTINRMKSEPEYKVAKVNGEWIEGPMKWIVLVFGPNHQAKDLKQLLQEEYKNLNIIVILVMNNRQTHRTEVMNAGQPIPSLWHNQSNVSTGLQGAKMSSMISNTKGGKDGKDRKPSMLQTNKGNINVNANEDNYQQMLNQLCKRTPEGYLITLEQRQFEGKENQVDGAGGEQKTKAKKVNFAGGIRNYWKDKNSSKTQQKQVPVAKEVERVFQKVCQSMELFSTDNIPIVTEFLEF